MIDCHCTYSYTAVLLVRRVNLLNPERVGFLTLRWTDSYMRINDAIIDTLTTNGITTVFGIPGKQTLPLNKSISERDDIRFVMARHETNVTHQAWGYAETSGEMAATVVIPGPGDMNAMNGLKNALNDCTPMLHIAVETEPDVRGGDGIHETPPSTYDNVVKSNLLVETPESVTAVLELAIVEAQTAPKGPVRVGIPKNFIPMEASLAATGDRRIPDPIPPVGSQIKAAVEVVEQAEAPMIIAGGGVRAADAASALLEFAELADAPVAVTYKGKATFPDDHPLMAGRLNGATSTELIDALSESDLIIGVGTDFDAVWTKGWSYDLPDELIHITVDPGDVGAGYTPSIAIIADARLALESITGSISQQNKSGASRAGGVRAAELERIAPLAAVQSAPLTSVSAVQALREALPRETILATDAGGSRIWTLVSFETYAPRDYVNPGSWASMGVSVPAGIGAKIANPDRPVVVIVGEGGLLMCIEELHTLVAEELDIIVVVLNNNDYAIISEEAERSYDLPTNEYGWLDTPLDVTMIAEGMGLHAERAESTDDIKKVTQKLLGEGPALIEIPTDPTEPQAGEFMIR